MNNAFPDQYVTQSNSDSAKLKLRKAQLIKTWKKGTKKFLDDGLSAKLAGYAAYLSHATDADFLVKLAELSREEKGLVLGVHLPLAPDTLKQIAQMRIQWQTAGPQLLEPHWFFQQNQVVVVHGGYNNRHCGSAGVRTKIEHLYMKWLLEE